MQLQTIYDHLCDYKSFLFSATKDNCIYSYKSSLFKHKL
jgi:hypothetical protein